MHIALEKRQGKIFFQVRLLIGPDRQNNRIEGPRSPRRASTANRQNHCRQAEPAGNALTFAVHRANRNRLGGGKGRLVGAVALDYGSIDDKGSRGSAYRRER